MLRTSRLPLAFALSVTVAMTLVSGVAPANADPADDRDPNFRCKNHDTWNQNATPWYDNHVMREGRLSDTVLYHAVPQGLTTWRNYYGTGKHLTVYTAYRWDRQDKRNKGAAYIQGIDPRDGSKTHFARIRGGHVGGVASYGRWIYVTHHRDANGWTYVRRYSKAALADVFSGRRSAWPKLEGRLAGKVKHGSFITIRGNTLFAGEHDKDSLGSMHRYRIGSDGNFRLIRGSRRTIPKKVQGLAVLRNHFIFTTSYGRTKRSNIYIARRDYTRYTRASKQGNLWCVRAPTMVEGVTVAHGKVWMVYESGADRYRYNLDGGGYPDRVTLRLHTLWKGALRNKVD